MTETIDITPAQRRIILDLLGKCLPNVTVWVYGSRVKWTARPESDLDMVVFTSPEQKQQVGRLKEAFEESSLPFRVDLFEWDEVPDKFRTTISTEHAVLVEEKNPAVPKGWKTIKLGRVCSKIGSGATPRGGSKVYLDHGPFSLVRSQNIRNDGFSRDGLTYISPEQADDLANVELQPRDVLLNITGDSVARCCLVDEDILPGRVNQHVAIIRPDPDQLDPVFLRYVLVSPKMQQKMLSWAAVGATRNALTKSMIEAFDVICPSPATQRVIAHILGSLDDKIALNRRMNRTLEKMAAAIFKSWFIDFDPVRAKADGRDPGIPAEIADLFPDIFEDSDLGPIPKGWEVGVIGDIAEQAIGGQWGSDSHDEGTVPAICLRGCDMEDLRANGYAPKAPVRFVKPSAIKTRLPSERDVLIAASGAGPCGRPLWCSVQIADLYQHPVIYSNFVKRFTTSSLAHAVYLDRFLIRKFNDGTIHDYINGTSVPNLDASGLLKTCKLLLPPVVAMKAFSEFCQLGFQRLYSGQSATLARIRDTLLPKLMSGEIEMPVAEVITEGVS
ncbi:MAG: restriction endonuclease subunit S [Kiritimatiellia bacterium]